MSKHTPGRWRVIASCYDHMVEGPNGEEIIWQDGPYQTPTIKLSDARLIAAAPEMLELLHIARTLLTVAVAASWNDDIIKKLVPECRAFMHASSDILAKIEGGDE